MTTRSSSEGNRMDYAEFIENKRRTVAPVGFEANDIHPVLYPFQREVVRWALSHPAGRAALFEDCGLGKTLQQLEWARHVVDHTGGRVLILAPLAVARQTLREANWMLLATAGVNVCRTQAEVRDTDRIVITNYEMMHHFDPAEFSGVVLDESSILKNYFGSVRSAIIDFTRDIPFRYWQPQRPRPRTT